MGFGGFPPVVELSWLLLGGGRRMHKENQRCKAWESTVRKAQLKRRGCSLFAPMSVAPLDDDFTSPEPERDVVGGDGSELCHVERLLSSGDFYTGLWCDERAHGTGKYLWMDGCMYEGEWQKGRMTGKGKFSWPSGATYEGDFNAAFLDGCGTFTGAAGDTYRGTYSMNLKHGNGARTYVNGDCYDGEWRFGVQNGEGRYTWKMGHEYNGGWKGGALSGQGVLVWASGNRYDGQWEDGAPCGKGQFRWSDGSTYVGIWSKDPSVRKGMFLPSASSASPGNLPRDPQDALAVDLDQCRICPRQNVSILPSQKVLAWAAAPEDDHLQAMPWRRSSFVDREPTTPDDADPKSGRSPPARWVPKQVKKKQGETISKGHKNYDLMLNLQLGIRHSVGRPAPATSLDLKASAFDPKEKLWTKFPPEGSKYTPPHQSCDFKWKDYCPVVFRSVKVTNHLVLPPQRHQHGPGLAFYCRTLRKLFKVDPADYMISICGNDALRELSSPGKSGSFFYLTHDDRYMIKTMKKSEVKVLLRMLQAYYNHVCAFENTLVTKFFGLHSVKLTGATQKKVRFVIMGNLFCSEYTIHRRFDLKGSSLGRTTSKPEDQIDANTTLKDLDLNFIFRLQGSWFQEFQRQIDRDCEFLEQERVMDYSLLVGIHFRDGTFSRDPFLSEGSSEISNMSEGTPRLSKVDMDQMFTDQNKCPSIKLGINMPCHVEHTVRKSDCDAQSFGDPTGDLYDVVLFFGIIDILQDYDISKKLEHAYKSIQYDPTSISAVDPRQYSRRFRDFIFKAFAEES